MNYKQKDIVLLGFPFSDLSSTKKRPALILSNNKFNDAQEDLICCLITTNLERDQNSVLVQPKDFEEGQLWFSSKIKPYRLFTAQKKIIEKKIAKLSSEKFTETTKKLQELIS